MLYPHIFYNFWPTSVVKKNENQVKKLCANIYSYIYSCLELMHGYYACLECVYMEKVVIVWYGIGSGIRVLNESERRTTKEDFSHNGIWGLQESEEAK